MIVLTLSEYRTLLAEQADDLHGMVLHHHRPADRIELSEKLLAHVGADDPDSCGVVILGRSEEPPGLEIEVVDLGHVCGHALNAGPQFLRAPLHHIAVRAFTHADRAAVAAACANG